MTNKPKQPATKPASKPAAQTAATKSDEAKKAEEAMVNEQKAKEAADKKAAAEAKKAEEAAKKQAEADAKADAKAQAKAESEALKNGGAVIRSSLDHSFTLADGTVVPAMVGDKRGAVAVKDGKSIANHGVVSQLVKTGVFEIEFDESDSEE